MLEKYLSTECWVSAKYLEVKTGLTERKIRDVVRSERESGVPILSGDSGYKLARDYSEIEPTVARLTAHGLSEIKIASALKRTFGKEQLTLGL